MSRDKFFEYLESLPIIQNYIVRLRFKYSWENETEYRFSNEIISYEPSLGTYVWEIDWDEGFEEVEILGCIPINNIKIDENLKEK